MNTDDRYTAAPDLVFSHKLPIGTTLIMYTSDTYYYYCISSAEEDSISVTSFVKMGSGEPFDYPTIASDKTSEQKYQFIIDFSQAKSYISGALNIELKYSDENGTDNRTAKSSITLENETAFSINNSGSTITLNAPANVDNSRWENRGQLLTLKSENTSGEEEKLPADTILRVTVDGQTGDYHQNSQNEFLIPLEWKESQQIGMQLLSDTERTTNRSYSFMAELGVSASGSDDKNAAMFHTNVTGGVTLQLAAVQSPSLKVESDKKLYEQKEKMKLTIKSANIENASLTATIKSGGETFYETSIQTGTPSIALPETMGPGSYCMTITAQRDGITILSVPYYFIVQ